jgi:lactate permease
MRDAFAWLLSFVGIWLVLEAHRRAGSSLNDLANSVALKHLGRLHTTWNQTYYVWGQGLAASAAIAVVPTLVLLYLLAVKRKASWFAALIGLCATLALALFAYGMPVKYAFSSAAYGAAFGLFPISWIVYWAIVLYKITVETGKFNVIRGSIGSLTPDWRIQALIIAFAFSAFIEGAAGFGTPVAVAAAMMVGLGYSAYYASAICLLANTAPVAFGSIGIPVITLAGITGLSVDKLSGAVGRICAPISLILPAYLIVVMGGFRSMLGVWPAVLVTGGAFASVQFLVSNYVGPQLTDILSSFTAMAALVALLRVWKPRRQQELTSHEMAGPAADLDPNRSSRSHELASGEETRFATAVLKDVTLTNAEYAGREKILAWTPYIFLVIFVLLWGFKPVQAILNVVTTAFAWPYLHNFIQRMPPAVTHVTRYPALFTFNWLSASGTSCMFATLLSALLLRMSPRKFVALLSSTLRELAFAIVTIAAVLSMAFVMNYSGITGTLGLAFAATGAAFPFFSAFLGWLGVFLTGSDTSSNALFGNLQVVTAGRLHVSPVLIAAANSAGGVMGKMISLQSIAVAAAATGLSVAKQAKLIRFTLRHSIVLASIVGLEVLVYAYLVHVV